MDVSHGEEGASIEEPREVNGRATLGYQGWAARRLVLACHRIFVSHGRGLRQPDEREELVSESTEHRGVIYWSLSNINADGWSASAAQTEADLEDEDVFHDGLTDFYHVWTLAEAFLLDSAPLPAAPLLRWLKMYSRSGEDEAKRSELDEAEQAALEADAVGGAADPDSGAYWGALRSLVVSVMPRRAAQMLRSHPEGRNNAGEVGALARQLEGMPLLLPEREDEEGDAPAGGVSGAEAHLDREGFFETWTRWQKGCKAAAARFGVVIGVGGDRSGGGGGGEQQRHLRWLWGTLCGERGCLVEATQSWAELFAAVLAFERPDTRKEEIAQLMRECLRTYSELPHESFLTWVIRDASAGAVDSILKFAHEHGETLALSACATHLVDLLSRAEGTSVTNQQRSLFFRRLAGHLKAFPCGGWELAAAYLGGGREGGHDNDDNGDDYEARLLRELAIGAVPGSERATHELVAWCHANCLGEETAAAVCRARGAVWIGKTGFSPAAMGTVTAAGEGGGHGSTRVAGSCGKAAYWLARAGGGVQLERLCAEVSERLMVEVSPDLCEAADLEVQQAALAEAEGVLAAIPPCVEGPELSFLARYREIADILSTEAAQSLSQQQHQRGFGRRRSLARGGRHARRVGTLAVTALAPPDLFDGGATGGGAAAAAATAALLGPSPPPRTWAQLLRLSVPALQATAAAAAAASLEGVVAPGFEAEVGEEGLEEPVVTTAQAHALLAKLQALVASEPRVGSVRGSRGEISRGSSSTGRRGTLASAPAPYGFRGGGETGEADEVSEIRRALAACLGATMMAQNAQEAAGAKGGWQRGSAAGRRGDKMLLGSKRLPADALIAPRVAV